MTRTFHRLLASLAGLTLLMALPSHAEDCAPWRVEGYHLGMSEVEAAELRPVKQRKGKVTVREKGSFKGQLLFDDAGALVQSGLAYADPQHDRLKRELTELLGLPLQDEAFVGTNRIGMISRTSLETSWASAECGAVVKLRREFVKTYAPGNVLQVDTENIYLVLVTEEGAERIDWKAIR